MIRDFADNVPVSYALAKLRTDITTIPDFLPFGVPAGTAKNSIVAMPESRCSTCESCRAGTPTLQSRCWDFLRLVVIDSADSEHIILHISMHATYIIYIAKRVCRIDMDYI